MRVPEKVYWSVSQPLERWLGIYGATPGDCLRSIMNLDISKWTIIDTTIADMRATLPLRGMQVLPLQDRGVILTEAAFPARHITMRTTDRVLLS